MRSIKNLALASTLLLGLAPLVDAMAGAITYTATPIPLTPLSWDTATTSPPNPFTVPQFDPSDGTLTGVGILFSGQLKADLSVENWSTTSGTSGTVNVFANLVLTGPSGSLSLQLQPSANTGPISLSTFDGVIDFAGTSGTTFSGLQGSKQLGQAVASTFFGLYTGHGTLAFDVAADPGIQFHLSGGLPIESTTQAAGAGMAITYTYQEPSTIPEPGVVGLMGIGLVGLAFVRRWAATAQGPWTGGREKAPTPPC